MQHTCTTLQHYNGVSQDKDEGLQKDLFQHFGRVISSRVHATALLSRAVEGLRHQIAVNDLIIVRSDLSLLVAPSKNDLIGE